MVEEIVKPLHIHALAHQSVDGGVPAEAASVLHKQSVCLLNAENQLISMEVNDNL